MFTYLFSRSTVFWDLDFLYYTSLSADVSSQTTSPTGVFFKSDGTKMYILQGFSLVYQYTLSPAWDVSSASYDSVSFNASEEPTNRALHFKTDGTSMYILGDSNNTVYQYTLSTGWDLNSASYASKSADVSTEEATATGLHFKSDGTSMYIIGATNDTVYQYTLSTAWDVGTASYASKSFSVNTQEGAPNSVSFKTDGTIMYIIGTANSTVYQYTLSSAWDVSTASYASKSFDTSNENTTPSDIFFKSDGKIMYTCDNGGDDIHQYIFI